MSFVFLEVDGESLLILERPEADVVYAHTEPVFVSFAERGPPGVGLPAGGTTGQILAKLSSTDADADWEDPPASGVWGQITGDITDQNDLLAVVASARLFATIF